MKTLKLIPIGMVACLLLGGVGCGRPQADQGSASEADLDLPADLRAMQGEWSAIETNEHAACSINIAGYTIRMCYQKAVDDPLLKTNISIMEIDQQKKILVMHNNEGAWTYNLQEEHEAYLFIEFFSAATHKWVHVCMKRKS